MSTVSRALPAAGPRSGASTSLKWAEIDGAALEANARAVMNFVGQRVQMMAMVKANGYGHDALLATAAFQRAGVKWFGVSSPEEALQLREAGVSETILNVGWTDPALYTEAIEQKVDLTIYLPEAVTEVADAARKLGKKARVHLKLDTGMNRLGLKLNDLAAMIDLLVKHRESLEVVSVFTHFADADAEDLAFTDDQLDKFLPAAERVRMHFPKILAHCANSAATLRSDRYHLDLVRPGLLLYGYIPEQCDKFSVKPAMRVVAKVTHIKKVAAGETVGYGRTWAAKTDSQIATLGIGYADGIHVRQSNAGHVLLAGEKCPIVGRVSMDQITVDTTACGGTVKVGDVGVILGSDGDQTLWADEIAKAEGTIPYEILCGISSRVPRQAW
jgi:alanine racemase